MSHPENTFRALKDQELFVDRWQCRFGWHRWALWEKPVERYGNHVQARKCVDCGCVTTRRVRGI